MTEPELYHFGAHGGFPNSHLPLLVYRSAVVPHPAAVESTFAANGWSNAWCNGIFGYHHFHSIAHEVLGIASGEVTVAFGGPSGQQVAVRAGDVVVIPAGVAHRNMGQSGDLLVVGAYPDGGDCDIRRGDAAELGEVTRAIAAVRLPDRDPVVGAPMGLHRYWRA